MPSIHWAELQAEAVRHLQALVQLDTSNPPGREQPAAEYLAQVLRAAGLTPLILESAPGRSNLYVRLPGQGAQPPLMLMSHLDVVPVNASEWTHPPFSGALIDGYVWGRGALDDKLVTVADLMTILLFQRHQLPLAGDLIMLAHADEESDFTYGMAWLVREHRDLFDAPFALYEGGAELTIAGQPFCLVDTAEKGWATVDVVLRGSGGHSSIPHPDNPLYHIAPLLHRLATHKLPVHPVDTVSQLFSGIGAALATQAPAEAALFQGMVDPAIAETLIPDLPVDAYLRHRFDALLRSTASPTLLQSGINRWTLPTEARLTLNGRLLPGQTGEDFDRELRAVVGPEFDYTIRDVHLGAECPRDTPLFDAIRRVVTRHDSTVAVAPNMMTGGTERGLLQDIGVQVYGFCPLREVPGQPAPFSLAHAPDERISVANLIDNCRSLFEVVCDMNNLEVQP